MKSEQTFGSCSGDERVSLRFFILKRDIFVNENPPNQSIKPTLSSPRLNPSAVEGKYRTLAGITFYRFAFTIRTDCICRALKKNLAV